MTKRLLCLFLVTAACAAGFTARADTPGFEQAMDDYAHARYVSAEGGFRAAAELGDVRAQEILGYMYAFGPNLYPGIQHNRHEAAVWFERAARGGSDSARYMYCALTRHAVTYRLRSAPCFAGRRDGIHQAGRN
jgi:TPR repeat protein